MPHGEMGASTSLVTASATNVRVPSLTAFTSAVRSAQIVPPYDAFSMFAPVMIFPSAESSAAPTRNLEYGLYAPDLAFPTVESTISIKEVWVTSYLE